MADSAHNGIVAVVPSRGRNGDVVFSVLVKRSYRIRHGLPAQRLEQDAPFRKTDVYYDNGDPSWSTVEHESEMAPVKASADVVVIGRAHAPGGHPTRQMAVGVRVADRRKVLRVIGDRRCHWRQQQPPEFSDPEPFTTMALRYERSYGGRDERPDVGPFVYPRNPMGKGVVLRDGKESAHDLDLPNIESPDDLLTPERIVIEDPSRWPEQPLPQGLGWYQRTWYPRSALLGVWPPFLRAGDVTPEERMRMLPADHIALARQMRLPSYPERFAIGASIGLSFSDLKGDEPVSLRGLTESGALDFSLPADVPQVALDIGSAAQRLDPRIHTVSIRPDDLELDVIWGASLTYGPAKLLAGLSRLAATVS